MPLGPTPSEVRARAIFAAGDEAVVFALLAQAKMPAERRVARRRC